MTTFWVATQIIMLEKQKKNQQVGAAGSFCETICRGNRLFIGNRNCRLRVRRENPTVGVLGSPRKWRVGAATNMFALFASINCKPCAMYHTLSKKNRNPLNNR